MEVVVKILALIGVIIFGLAVGAFIGWLDIKLNG